MGTKTDTVEKIYTVLGGHIFLHEPNGPTIPLDTADDRFLNDTLKRTPTERITKRYQLSPDDLAALDAVPFEKSRYPKAAAQLCSILNDSVSRAKYDALVAERDRYRKGFRFVAFAKLELDRIGEAVRFELYAKRGTNYVKGVRVHTSEGRRIDFYGSRREDVSLVAIDGFNLPWGLTETSREIVTDSKNATESFLEDARLNWRGKQKIEREQELGREVLII